MTETLHDAETLGSFVGGAVALVLLCTPTSSAALPAIGRLQSNTSQCSYVDTSGTNHRCNQLQLDRKTDTVMRLRFLGEANSYGATHTLTFVTVAADQRLPVDCEQGHCRLNGRSWTGPVMGAAEALMNQLGLAEGLPKAWSARGSCTIDQQRISCKASASNGSELMAEASLKP